MSDECISFQTCVFHHVPMNRVMLPSSGLLHADTSPLRKNHWESASGECPNDKNEILNNESIVPRFRLEVDFLVSFLQHPLVE
jgi:hypothetical protein